MSQEAVYQRAPRVVHDAPTHRAATRRRLAAASLRRPPTTPRSLEPPSPLLAPMSSSNRPRLTRYASDLRKSTCFLASHPHGARPELPRLACSPLFRREDPHQFSKRPHFSRDQGPPRVRMVPSKHPPAIFVPSDDTAIAHTLQPALIASRAGCPVRVSQRRMASSRDPDTSRRPSKVYATE